MKNPHANMLNILTKAVEVSGGARSPGDRLGASEYPSCAQLPPLRTEVSASPEGMRGYDEPPSLVTGTQQVLRKWARGPCSAMGTAQRAPGLP